MWGFIFWMKWSWCLLLSTLVFSHNVINKDADQSEHIWNLISIFGVHFLERIQSHTYYIKFIFFIVLDGRVDTTWQTGLTRVDANSKEVFCYSNDIKLREWNNYVLVNEYFLPAKKAWTNSADPDQTASKEAVWSGLLCLFFWQVYCEFYPW